MFPDVSNVIVNTVSLSFLLATGANFQRSFKLFINKDFYEQLPASYFNIYVNIIFKLSPSTTGNM